MNQATTNGGTPAFIAAQEGHLEVVKVLLSQKNYQAVPFKTTIQKMRLFAQEKNEAVIERVNEFITSKGFTDENATLEIYPKEIAMIMGHEDIAMLFKQPTLKRGLKYMIDNRSSCHEEEQESKHFKKNP